MGNNTFFTTKSFLKESVIILFSCFARFPGEKNLLIADKVLLGYSFFSLLMECCTPFLCETSYAYIGSHHLCAENNTLDYRAGLEERIS